MYKYIFDGEEFDYTPSDEDLMQACTEFVRDEYFVDSRYANALIVDFDIKDRVADFFEKELHDYFEREAREAYKWYKRGQNA